LGKYGLLLLNLSLEHPNNRTENAISNSVFFILKKLAKDWFKKN